MDGQNKLEVQQISFECLTAIDDLQNSGNLIQGYIKGHSWHYSFNCITQLRKINKYHSEYIPDIIERYSPTILDLLNTGKTLLVKNILKLVKELFDAGQNINVEKAVYAFLPLLIKKASTDIGYMKVSAQQVLTSFIDNCGYQISFIIASEYCCDKNSSIAELSIKLLAALIQKVGSGMMQLSENTLNSLMRCLSSLVEGKRQNLHNSALDICIFICESIGSDNYLSLMQFCLKQDEIRSMGTFMENHRQNKEKPLRLKQAIKTRRTEAFNADFFNDNKNFVPLGQKQMNYDYNNNYNSNPQYQYNSRFY